MTEPDVLRIILSLIFVVALILGGSWLARRAGWIRTGQVSGMKILGVQSLGARAYIALVQVEDTRLVVGVTQQNITLLHTLGVATNTAPGAEGYGTSGLGTQGYDTSASGTARSGSATASPYAEYAPAHPTAGLDAAESQAAPVVQGKLLNMEPAENAPVTKRTQGFSQLLNTVLKKR